MHNRCGLSKGQDTTIDFRKCFWNSNLVTIPITSGNLKGTEEVIIVQHIEKIIQGLSYVSITVQV